MGKNHKNSIFVSDIFIHPDRKNKLFIHFHLKIVFENFSIVGTKIINFSYRGHALKSIFSFVFYLFYGIAKVSKIENVTFLSPVDLLQ